MKIAMVVSGFPVLSQTFISLQIARLHELGFNLKIINMGRAGKAGEAPESLRPFLDELVIIAPPFDGRGRYLKMIAYAAYVLLANTSRAPLASFRLFADKVIKLKIPAFLRLHHTAFLYRKCYDADVIHFQFATLAYEFCQIKKYGFPYPEAKWVCSVRGYDVTRQSNRVFVDWNALFRETLLFLPVCNYLASTLREMGCAKEIKIVRSPVNAKGAIPNEHNKAAEKINIVSVGRLVEKKGFDDALEAIHILSQSFSDFKYKIIGNGPCYHFLRSKISEKSLSERVELMGALSPDETLGVMAASDILLAPSKTAADGDSEGIPNTIKEAMVLGLQIVTTAHAGIPELIEHGVNGLLVPEGSPEKIAEAIKELISDAANWHQRAERAKTTILKEYTPEKTTEILIEAYESTMNRE